LQKCNKGYKNFTSGVGQFFSKKWVKKNQKKQLLSKLDINQEIPQEMYKAVAEIFSFVYSLTKK